MREQPAPAPDHLAQAEVEAKRALMIIKRQNLCIREITKRIAARRVEVVTDPAYQDLPEGFPIYIETSEISGIILSIMNRMTDEEVHEAY